jgi:hypothetical protein
VATVTLVDIGVPSCAVDARRRRALQPGSNAASCSTGSIVLYDFVVPVIVPLAGSATKARDEIKSLGGEDFLSTSAIIANSSGCPASAFTFSAPVVAAVTCGSSGSTVATCNIPTEPAQSATVNVGALIGGVIGGVALFALFVILVLALRGNCRCCGGCCPQQRPKPLGVEV